MLRTKTVSLTSARMKILKEKKKKKLEKGREEYMQAQAKSMAEKEKEQVRKYQELKKTLIEYIHNMPGAVIISEEENYLLVAKDTKISVNIIKTANVFQPYKKEAEEHLCIVSLIDFGRKKGRSDLYNNLADVSGCKTYRVSHIDDIEFVLKKLDEI